MDQSKAAEAPQDTSLSEQAATAALEKATVKAEGGGAQDENQETLDIIDIDSVPKVKFNGEEYTPEELNRMVMRQSDYTRKTQKLAEERKFMDNLQYDLENVRRNPELADQFKAIYPEKFHAFLNIAMNNGAKTGAGEEKSESDQGAETLKKQIDALQKKLDSYDQKFHDEKVEAANAQLDAIFGKLSSKYELADEDAIVNRAQRLLEENRDNPAFKMTDSAWERLFKIDHEMREQRYSERQKKLLAAQAKQGSKGIDGGPGGVAPGRPKKRMNFEDATELMIQDLS